MPRGKLRPQFQSVQQVGDFLSMNKERGIYDQKLYRIYFSLEELPKDFEKRLHTFLKELPFHEFRVARKNRLKRQRKKGGKNE